MVGETHRRFLRTEGKRIMANVLKQDHLKLMQFSSKREDLALSRLSDAVFEAITQDNLLNVKCHAIHAVETMKEYVEDARQSGDDELVEYFERLSQAYIHAAHEATQLLVGRLSKSANN